jgi:hypothetical protein
VALYVRCRAEYIRCSSLYRRYTECTELYCNLMRRSLSSLVYLTVLPLYKYRYVTVLYISNPYFEASKRQLSAFLPPLVKVFILERRRNCSIKSCNPSLVFMHDTSRAIRYFQTSTLPPTRSTKHPFNSTKLHP